MDDLLNLTKHDPPAHDCIYLTAEQFRSLPVHHPTLDTAEITALPFSCWKTEILGVWMYIEKLPGPEGGIDTKWIKLKI